MSKRPRRSLRRPPTQQTTKPVVGNKNEVLDEFKSLVREELHEPTEHAEHCGHEEHRPFTQRELDRMGCHVENCGHAHDELFIHCVDHQGQRLEIRYRKVNGVLDIACPQCESIICSLLIAEG